MARENIGEIQCPGCANNAPLRKNKNGRLYINCATCGILAFSTDAGQKMLLEKGEIYGAATPAATAAQDFPRAADSAPAPAPKPVKKKPVQPAAAPAPAPAPAPVKKPGLLDDVL